MTFACVPVCTQDKDISALASAFDGRLIEQENEWNERLARETDHGKDDQARFRNSLVKLAYRYARLTVLSFGFQQAFRPGGGSGGKEGGKEEERKPFFERVSLSVRPTWDSNADWWLINRMYYLLAFECIGCGLGPMI